MWKLKIRATLRNFSMKFFFLLSYFIYLFIYFWIIIFNLGLFWCIRHCLWVYFIIKLMLVNYKFMSISLQPKMNPLELVFDGNNQVVVRFLRTSYHLMIPYIAKFYYETFYLFMSLISWIILSISLVLLISLIDYIILLILFIIF